MGGISRSAIRTRNTTKDRRGTAALLLACVVIGRASTVRAQGAAPADAPRPPHETLFYTSAGLRLEAYPFTPQGPGPFPLVVYNHGSRAGQERVESPFYYVAELLVPNGYAVLVPERRGHGKSEGATFAGEIGDDRGPKFVARLRAEACAVAENDRTTASAKVICDAINANGTATELKVYPPFTPPRPAPNGVPGHAIFGRAGVPIWGRDALAFLARYVR